jgi:hypothetical protein
MKKGSGITRRKRETEEIGKLGFRNLEIQSTWQEGESTDFTSSHCIDFFR